MLFTRMKRTMASLAVLLAAAFGTGGCAGGKLTPVTNEAEFQEVVLGSKVPVLVDFYKGGCPTCIALDPVMDQLVDEYRGRAVIAKFMIMTPTFQITSPEIKQKYDIHFYPTAVLFVNGQEQKRWIIHYAAADYRKALDEFVQPDPAAKEIAQDDSWFDNDEIEEDLDQWWK